MLLLVNLPLPHVRTPPILHHAGCSNLALLLATDVVDEFEHLALIAAEREPVRDSADGQGNEND
jgi:hypothetical protein